MKTKLDLLAASLFLAATSSAWAGVHYVDVNGTNPKAPYTDWSTAATNIQNAIDAAVAGEEVVVTNGVYQTGGRVVSGSMTNRVAVTKRLVVRSVNGPEVTVIKGYQVPGTTNGDSAVRCVYLTGGAWLIGFTLTNGATRTTGDDTLEQRGGGVWCKTSAGLSNCVLTGNSASSGGGAYQGTLNNCTLNGNSARGTYYSGGGASGGTLNNCTLTGNSADYGGGADGGTLNNCTLTGNWASYGDGGASSCTLNNCTLTGNSTTETYAYGGGGAYYGTLSNCTLTANSSSSGGGASRAFLNNCTLTGNSASGGGGGASSCALNNCTLTGNAADYGGGAYSGTLNNCTLTGNSSSCGGGVSVGTLNNCIVYYNSALASPNYSGGTLNYCCTTPLASGVGNIEAEPQLASASHLSALSPCRNAGSAAYASGTDIDGEPWANPPSIGCVEFNVGAVTGPISVSIQADYSNVMTGFNVSFTGAIEGRVTASRWEFGDGTIVSNRPYTSHAWSAPGDYPVVLRAYNESNPGGVSAIAMVRVVAQPVHYVALGCLTPQAPYDSWGTAATNIQDAVDAAAVPGALVLVTNGVYQTGGRVVSGSMTNRVAVTKRLVVCSVNGPEVTVIKGYQMPGTKNGDSAVRCAYLTNGAWLVGFTLTNGATRTTGDYALEQSGGGVWCEISAVVSNCVLRANSAADGGGGAYSGTLNNCTLTGNSATGYYGGGGASICTLNNCTLTGNSASSSNGGGASSCTLNNCTLTGNSASSSGGGAYQGTLNNCTLTGNSASYDGGGAYSGTLNNCTLTANSAVGSGGGAYGARLTNSIVYFNTAAVGANYDDSSTLNYCCTTPLPATGTGNISDDPQLASASHLSALSPCRNAGSAAYASGTDIDGEPWANPPSIGCDEFNAGAVTGPISVSIQADYTNVAPGFAVSFTGTIEGRLTASRWEFGDGTIVSNRPYTSHAWSAPGDYPVVLRAYNGSYPGGVSAIGMVRVVAEVHYVALDSLTPQAPYDSWGTAATNIQDAVDAAVPGALVLVTNGVYQTGGRVVSGSMTNRVAVTKPLVVRSVNGPEVTVIKGYQMPGTTNGDSAVRCVYLTNGAWLVGFTLTNGATRTSGDYTLEQSGGGVSCETSAGVSNCVLTANSAYYCGGGAYQGTLNNCTLTGNSAYSGGGAYYGTLNNCTLTGNSASSSGGGANSATLNNCTLTGNSAYSGGGAYYGTLNNCTLTGNSASSYGGGARYGTLNNCILYYNSAPTDPNYSGGTLKYCCTTPLPATGVGNFTNAPLFVDYPAGNLRLQSGSPCVNAGTNAYAVGAADLDGRPRIVGGRVDLGAYEFQGAGLGEFIGWLQRYGLPWDGSADYTDADHDGLNNWQEWCCGTDPTNSLSILQMLSSSNALPGVTVSWQSVAGVKYFIECSTNVAATPSFTCVATNIPGQPGTTTYTDTNAVGTGPFFYRMGVSH